MIELRDHPYVSDSHTFNRGIIAAYNNVRKNGIILERDYIAVVQQQRTSVFQFSPEAIIPTFKRKSVIYSEFPVAGATKIKEVCYDLKSYFAAPDSETRRLIRFKDREQVKFQDVTDVDECLPIYEAWVAAKKADPRVFQISFNPVRYRRSYELKGLGFNIYQKLIFVNGSPYAVINFAIEGKNAYEISFCSKYYDRSIKLINDQNDAIIVSALHDLYTMGIETVNLGTDAGIKGLAFFKKKLPHHLFIVYSRKAP